MFLNLGHTKLAAYTAARQFVKECYLAVARFPNDERFVISQQVKRAALSVYLNVAEGSSRKSQAERNRFYEIARGSVIEVDAALDVAFDLGYCSPENLKPLRDAMINCFKYLSGLISTDTK